MAKFIRQVSYALLSMGIAATVHAQSPSCTSLSQFKAAGFDVSIKKTANIAAGPVPTLPFEAPFPGTLPEYCRVDGVMDERIGRDGKPYAIGFAIALPSNWNGRYLMQGGGGLNGSVASPVGNVAVGSVPALARGFAVITTDTGHQGANAFDAGFMVDQEAVINFYYQAIGKVAQVGKQIVAAYYNKGVEHSYFMGCSTGGREAMLMAQRYPRLFDGVIAGNPGMRTGFSNLATKWLTVALNQAAPKDDQGKPQTSRVLSDADRKLVIDSLLKTCDANDGVTDGMVFDTRGCNFDPMQLACKSTKSDACLTREQATALKKGFAGPTDSRGIAVYPGFWFDSGIADKGFIAGLLNPGPSPVGGAILATQMDVDKEALVAGNPHVAMGDTAHWTQLNTFADHGKLIFFHGVSDPWFSAKDTARYYEQLVNDNGGAAAVSNWSRLFLVPGMGHCAGGSTALDRFDLLDPIVNWVEKGQAPVSVNATGKAFANRSRPLCPYPQHAHFKGQGDTEKAEYFECR
jgi:pimeloyl-ACP methyl ester carboxylesterase